MSIYLFLKGVDRGFAWSFETVKLDVSLDKYEGCEVTDTTGVQSISLYSWLGGGPMVLQVEART